MNLLRSSPLLALTTLFCIFSSSVSFQLHRFDHALSRKIVGRSMTVLAAKTTNSEDDRSWLKSRRSIIQSLTLGAIPLVGAQSLPSVANALVSSNGNLISPESSTMENGLLEIRVLENLMSPPPYGMEAGDIYYPSYFGGVWDTESITTSISAPCGIAFFGGNSTYNRALEEIGKEKALFYRSRFIPSLGGGGDSTIADREYNVREIVKATMGENAVVDIPFVGPNKLSCILSPQGSGMLLQADLLTLARRQENVSSCEFHASEVSRQIVAPANKREQENVPMGKGGKSSLLKEIETSSLYTILPSANNDVNEIRCRQRSATFLLPSQQDPMAYKMWEATRGRPIDVRFYDVTYKKRISK